MLSVVVFDDVDDLEVFLKKQGKKFVLGARYPENDKSARDIEKFLDGIENVYETKPMQIITQSTYLIRRILARKMIVEFVNVKPFEEILRSPNINGVGKIEIFERELNRQ